MMDVYDEVHLPLEETVIHNLNRIAGDHSRHRDGTIAYWYSYNVDPHRWNEKAVLTIVPRYACDQLILGVKQ